MTVTQTVEIPASHRLTIDVPSEVPAGPAVIVFKPAAEPTGMTGKTVQEAMEAIERCSGLAVRLGINLSSDEFLKMRHQDKELEDRLDHLDQWQ